MDTAKLSGSFDIEIDQSFLNATLVYYPDQEGEFDSAAVLSALSDKGVTSLPSQDDVSKKLASLRKQVKKGGAAEPDGDLREVLASGEAPELPQPEEVQWKELELPEAYQGRAEEVIRNAGPPQITITRTEKVKKKKKVRKKSKLPFGKDTIETVETTENVSREEPVAVNPKVLQTAYVENGEVLAEITPAKPGTPGRDLAGKPIPPPVLEQSGIYAGKGAEKRKTELVAAATGFMRRGENWVEVLPFKAHSWEVHPAADGLTWLLDYTPGQSRAERPAASTVIERTVSSGAAAEDLLSEEELEAVLEDAFEREVALDGYPVTRKMDSSISVNVDEAELKATLTIRKGRGGGKPLVMKDVGRIIKESGIKGFDVQKVKQDLSEFVKSDKKSLENYLLVEGKAPTRNADREIKTGLSFLDEKETETIRRRALENPHTLGEIESLDEFPMDSVTSMAYIEAGQEIGSLYCPKPGEPGQNVYGVTLPVIPGNDPEVRFYENVQMIQDSIKSTARGVLDWGQTDEGAVLLRVRPHEDSRIAVSVSEDRMSAFLTLDPSIGTGVPVDMESVQKAIEQRGVKSGIREDVLEAAVEKALEGEPVRDLKFAGGTAPVSAGETELRFRVNLASGKGVTLREDGTADYRNQDRYTPVKEHDVIADIYTPADTTQDGVDVTGQTIPAKNGKPLNLETGTNIRRDETDEGVVHLVAARSGNLFYDGKFLDVLASYKIDGDVDLNTGNIKFPGDVHVTGSVSPKFYIMTGGTVHIDENVESALVSADGDIVVGGGVKGHGKAALRSKKNIQANYLEQATILSVGNLTVKNACIGCNIKCNGKFELNGEKGYIIGGKVRARNGVVAKNLGSERGSATHISFGQDYLIGDRIELEQKELEKAQEKAARFDFLMKKEENSGMKSHLAKLRKEKLLLLKQIEKRSLRLFTLREKFEEHYPAEIVVQGTVFPGVILESHTRQLEITKKKTKVKFVFERESGHIREYKLEKDEEAAVEAGE
ncbi:MAG: FapA family protein [Spirochaetales bacterium]|nr:FapA family protein [Spirochaetales bacterium]MCF7938691.1 FapA family protein [Spirochaetales bacterium]